MKKFYSIFVMLAALHASATLQAQTVLDQFNFIADQAEALFPEEFPTGPETFSAQELGFSWHARFYPQTGIYVALNIDESTIYTFGGPWPEPTVQGTLQGILDQLGYVPPSDGGGTGGGGTGGSQNAILQQGGGSCVDLTYPSVGLVASYEGTQTVEGISTQISYTDTYTAVSTNSITKSTEQLVTGAGFSASSSSVTTSFLERMDGWLFTTETDAEFTTTTTSPAGQSTVTSTTNLLFDPPQGSSPETICDGMIFFIASVTSTSTGTSGGVPLPETSAPTGESEVEVISVNESLTVPAGTFSTVRQINKSLDDDGEVNGFSEGWFINGEGGVPARLDFYETSNGMDTLISTIELQSIDN